MKPCAAVRRRDEEKKKERDKDRSRDTIAWFTVKSYKKHINKSDKSSLIGYILHLSSEKAKKRQTQEREEEDISEISDRSTIIRPRKSE